MADKDSRYRFLRLYVMQDLGLEYLGGWQREAVLAAALEGSVPFRAAVPREVQEQFFTSLQEGLGSLARAHEREEWG